MPFADEKNSIRASQRTLFIDPRKISTEAEAYLQTLSLEVRPYDEVWDFLTEVVKGDLAVAEKKKPANKICTGLSISWAVQLALGKVRPVEQRALCRSS